MSEASLLTKVELKPLASENIVEISRIHLEAFPDSSWSKLGARVVENYYLWQLEGPHRIVAATGAYIEGECAGFCFSGIFNGSTSGFIKRNRFMLIKKTLFRPWLIFDANFLLRLSEGVRLLRRFSAKKQSQQRSPQQKIKSFGILSIAVSPRYRNLGIGKKLMNSAEQSAVKCGYEQMHLTVNPANHTAINFYERLDWEKSLNGDLWQGLMRKTRLTETSGSLSQNC